MISGVSNAASMGVDSKCRKHPLNVKVAATEEQITADIRMVPSVNLKAIAAASLGLHPWAMPRVENKLMS